jgi:hypothetical protein
LQEGTHGAAGAIDQANSHAPDHALQVDASGRGALSLERKTPDATASGVYWNGARALGANSLQPGAQIKL